ncbi:MAG: CidA/LrgA family protein [Bacteroidales bacterium]|nr:CidA/LrgA family protein [Bacteroidales bacterium]
MIQGFGIVMAFYALGEAVAVLFGHFVPGSVVGMVLLFFALCIGWVKAESIRAVASFLTGNMALLFIPTFMGIIDTWGLIRLNWLGWLAVVLLSTVAVMAASGYSVELVEWFSRKRTERNSEGRYAE